MENKTKFEVMQPFTHMSLYALRDPRTKILIGYVQKIPNHGWCWYSSAKFSEPFGSKEDALNDLIRNYTIYNMDTLARKTGIINNEELVKK